MTQPKLVGSYVMTHDSGVAPNPFHGVCTLAVCTPNHQRANLQKDDWLIGTAGANIREKLQSRDVWRLIYAMKIDRILSLDGYYNDPKFKNKIPKKYGTPLQQCGDNFYRKDTGGRLYHTGETEEHQSLVPGTGIEAQDITGDRVFTGRDFWYFGKDARPIPMHNGWGGKLAKKFVKSSVGLRYVYCRGNEEAGQWSEDELREFMDWLPKKAGHFSDPFHFDLWQNESACKATCGA